MSDAYKSYKFSLLVPVGYVKMSLRHYIPTIILFVVLLHVIHYDISRDDTIYNITLDGYAVNFTGVEDFIPPFINIVSDYFISPQHKLMACGIRKSMSQLTINTMCMLYDKNGFQNEHQSLNDTWLSQEACVSGAPGFRYPSPELEKDGELTRFAFIRDPFDRFISFFLDKCIRENDCWSCQSDMRCVVQLLHKSLYRYKKNRTLSPSYAVLHAAPLSWNCDFDKHLSKYSLLAMGADQDQRKSSILQLGNILHSKGIDGDTIEQIINGSLAGETVHGTHKMDDRAKAEHQVITDPFVRDYLHKIYFYDYLIFPFSRDTLDYKYRTDFWKYLSTTP